MQRWRSIAAFMVNDLLAPSLDGRDYRCEILRLHRICPGFMHVPHRRAEVIEGTLTILLTQALDCTLKAEDAEIEKLDAAVVAHAGDHGGTASTGGYRGPPSMVTEITSSD